jgi:hypothetical protein
MGPAQIYFSDPYPTVLAENNMINAEDEIYYDLRTSCTCDEAVAKLLGWMRGPIRRRHLSVTEHSDSVTDLPHLDSLNGSLQQTLEEMRETARQDLLDAVEAGVSTYVFLDKDFAVRRFDALTIDAATYLADINDELAKGGASALRIDSMATAKSGVVHISLRSLDDWASRRYGISILGDSEFQQFDSSTDTSQPEPQAPQPASEKPWLIAQPNDPLVMQPWFTPARYFARQLVADDPTLRLKRDQLANKVVQLLTDVGIFKRGGKKPFDPGTVKKAFVNVRF